MSDWNEEQSKMYNVRFKKTDALHKALEKACDHEQIAPVRYIKTALIEKLQRDGFLTEYVELHGVGKRPTKP